MADLLQGGFEFASKVVKVLNDSGLTEVKDAVPYCALMVVACPADTSSKEMPVGFSINYNFDKAQWELAMDAQHSEVCEV